MKKLYDGYKPIQTNYNGFRFRSRAEARWAVFFDVLAVRYLYEPEGFRLSDGTMYLPDFYLPDCNMWFEVKGVMDEIDQHKIEQLMFDTKKPVVVGYSDLSFEACDKWENGQYTRSEMNNSWLCQCRQCKRLWFMGNEGSYVCANCGCYTGDDHFEVLLNGMDPADSLNFVRIKRGIDKSKFRNIAEFAVYKARQARFEFDDAISRINYQNN